MTAETAGIREIDTGVLPDRYARGWHCLGPVTDYLDGKPHGIEIFGTMLVVFADSRYRVPPSEKSSHQTCDSQPFTRGRNTRPCPLIVALSVRHAPRSRPRRAG